MASRYLLIEFDDEQQATRLREQINNATRAGKKFRVVGLFAKPTNYCQCNPEQQVTTRGKVSRNKRGKKFGWWVCLDCKRPVSSLTGLVNLLKPRDIINPPKWKAKAYPLYKQEIDFQHYIPSLSGETIGEPGVKFWNDR